MNSSSAHPSAQSDSSQDLQPKILVSDIDANRDAWLQARKNKISSSNVAIVCGLSQYKSPLELWAEWTGKIPDIFEGNRHTQLGIALEPVVAKWWSDTHNCAVQKANKLYGDAEHDWLVASPDYILPHGWPLEIKTGHPRTAHRWENGKAPDEYILQVQIQMRVLRQPSGVLTAYLGDVENCPSVHLEYDTELFSMVQEKAARFLECVQRDVPPDAGPGDAKIISAITHRNPGTTVQWAGEQEREARFFVTQAKLAAETMASCRKQLDELEAIKKTAENRLKQLLGTATAGEFSDGKRVTVSTVRVKEKLVGAYEYERMTLPK